LHRRSDRSGRSTSSTVTPAFARWRDCALKQTVSPLRATTEDSPDCRRQLGTCVRVSSGDALLFVSK
jgi:hypothetical protein